MVEVGYVQEEEEVEDQGEVEVVEVVVVVVVMRGRKQYPAVTRAIGGR